MELPPKLVGLDKQVERFKKLLQAASYSPIILHGRPGMGKTTIVYWVARELGYKVIEYNMSDVRTLENLEKIYIAVRTKKPYKVIFLLDEIDGMAVTARGGRIPRENVKMLFNIILHTRHPLVMTCNDISVLENAKMKVEGMMKSIVDMCQTIGFYRLNSEDLLKAARMYGRKSADRPPSSFRQAKLAKFYGDSTSHESRLDAMRHYFTFGVITQYDRNIGLMLLENVIFNKLLDNWQLYEFIKSLVVASRLDSPEPLNGIHFEIYKEEKLNLTSTITLWEKLKQLK